MCYKAVYPDHDVCVQYTWTPAWKKGTVDALYVWSTLSSCVFHVLACDDPCYVCVQVCVFYAVCVVCMCS